jgi:IS605 OrfB family transposase
MGVEKQTRKSLGGIGVDLNKAHLAWAEINRHGNLVKFGKIGIEIQDRRSDQVTASLGEAIKEILEYAKKQQKPIVIEKLDFQRKKAKESGRGGSCASPRYRRMLSYFAYSKFMEIMYSRAFREGVEIIAVNPAYSSIIGRCKFAGMYGISVHIAASLVLARRGLELGESFPSTQYLAEHRYWHIWKKWARFAAVSNREKQVGFVPRLTSNRKRPPLGGFF